MKLIIYSFLVSATALSLIISSVKLVRDLQEDPEKALQVVAY